MEITDFKTKDATMNSGCNYGNDMLLHSIKSLGLCRSVVADKNNTIIVGDKTYRAAVRAGIKKVCVIETTGDTLVVVKRTDIDADSTRGLEISLVDNLCSEENLSWDSNVVVNNVNNHLGFSPEKWGGDSCIQKEFQVQDILLDTVEKKQATPSFASFSSPSQLSLFD